LTPKYRPPPTPHPTPHPTRPPTPHPTPLRARQRTHFKQLQRAPPPLSANKDPAPRIKRIITAPDGKPRTIDVRGKQDHIDSAKDSTFAKASRLKLLALAQSLPPHTNLDDLDTRAGDFQTECITLLSEPGTDIYAIRQLLPIKESGTLVPSDPNSNQKPDATYTPITSTALGDQAIAIGALKKDE